MIRVLIADDSAFMRKVLSDLFNSQSDFQVVGTAANGQDAIDKVKKFHPDVLTLDVIMPVMDGLEALAVIMQQCPLPVVMVSSTTQKGTNETIRALALGAVDFVSKDGGAISKIDSIKDEILAKCRLAARARPQKNFVGATRRIEVKRKSGFVPKPRSEPARKISPTGNKLVLIGSSTGGPQALQTVITRLPKNLPCGVVIVQHMPAGFTKSLADRLNSISDIAVSEATHDEIIRPGHVYIAPGDFHARVAPYGSKERKIVLSKEPRVGNLRPTANYLFESGAQFGGDLVSVILTGMGSDGCEGMKLIKSSGGYVIAQDEASCVVYGMPKAVVDAGLADEILPLYKIADSIVAAVSR